MFCEQCGSELRDGARFCSNCGANQNVNVAATAQNTASYVTPAQQPVYQVPEQHWNAYNPNVGEVHNGKVGFGKAISLFFKNYVNFRGRASRSEYWWVFLFYVIIFFPLGLISGAVPLLGGLCSIAFMIPRIALTVRRLHDVGKSGAWYFMGFIPIAGVIILLIQFLKDSEGDNQWGPGPVVNVSEW